MHKTIIGVLVGAVIIFAWQTLSWTMLDLHRSAEDYTPKQDSILAYLNTQFSEDGSYSLPTVPATTTWAEADKLMKNMEGKPWAMISYHKAYNINMGLSLIRVFLVNIVLVWLLCWILGKIDSPGFGTFFMASLFVGLIVFLNSAYTYHIWYQSRDLSGHLIDALMSWGLTGLWLGWWMNRKK